MNLEVHGSRPPSSRRQNYVNPITGEEMPHSARSTPRPGSTTGHRPKSRPDEVPSLNLGQLADGWVDENKRPKNLDPYHYKLDTPNTGTTVSWGTPTSISVRSMHEDDQAKQKQNRYQNEHVHVGVIGGIPPAYNTSRYVNTKPSEWDKDPVPDNLPAPSEKYKKQYEQYQQEMKDAYKLKSARNITEQDIEKEVDKLRLQLDVSNIDDEESSDIQMSKTYKQQPYGKATLQKKLDVEELENEKKKKKMIETVMIDELSRFPVCDVEQNEVLSQRVPAYTPGQQRGAVRKLHDSRVRTATSATENLLSRRVRFGARMLTRIGRDAVRELSGFFFAVDNSLTIYEFRQFGKSAKALPFIKRGVYTHQVGKRKGEPYTLQDILQGGNLIFATAGQPIPEQMMSQPTLTFRVTDVDDEAKSEILLESVPLGDRAEMWRRMHLPPTKKEIQDYVLMKKVQGIAQKQIERRGIKVMTGLGQHFHKVDDTGGTGKLNKYELEKALIDFHINIPDELFDDLWEVLDYDQSSFMDYDAFMQGYLGEMTEGRKAIVRKAYLKLDSTKRGWVMIDDMRKFYNAQKHPKVKARECREDEMLQIFLSSFEFRKNKDCVTYEEFELYYEGLSVCVEDDEDFSNMIKNAWSV